MDGSKHARLHNLGRPETGFELLEPSAPQHKRADSVEDSLSKARNNVSETSRDLDRVFGGDGIVSLVNLGESIDEARTGCNAGVSGY
jgi:hypothetical protein